MKLSVIFICFLVFLSTVGEASSLDKKATQWAPFVEWSIRNSSYTGNPFDLEAQVIFHHRETGKKHMTFMFFAGEDNWKFRFTGTLTGVWDVTTVSNDEDLNGHSGIVTVEENPDSRINGFLVNLDGLWGWQNTGRVFTPQLIMYKNPAEFFQNIEAINDDIEIFIDQHGFSGFHVPDVAGWWYDIEQSSNQVDPGAENPDPRTFEALELLISRTHAVGAMVHIWMWGDQERKQTPLQLRGGVNGPEDRRLQRYIASRLGPLPGWSMGYGFDLWEWIDEAGLDGWHQFMHQSMGWSHLLGARSGKNDLNQLSAAMDYASYEWHRPDYENYVEHLMNMPDKPAFSEDRFRIANNRPYKDYDLEMTRRGFWHSTMAGGVANIWGNLQLPWWQLPWFRSRDQLLGSFPYPNAEALKTYDIFFNRNNRFRADLMRVVDHNNDANETPTRILKTPDDRRYIYYREDSDSVSFDLSLAPAPLTVIAVDTRQPYRELQLGVYQPGIHEFEAPHQSDWALAIGEFVD